MPHKASPEDLRNWASDWADEFDQNWDRDKLYEWVGKTVTARTPDGEHGFKATIVGFDIITLYYTPEDGAEPQPVYRFSFLTDEGISVSLRSGMEVSEAEDV